MSSNKRANHPSPAPRSWWQEPMVWLVIGGPAVVVVASISTAVVAYRGAEVVLQEPAEVKKVNVRPESATPAMQARNHAATAAAGSN